MTRKILFMMALASQMALGTPTKAPKYGPLAKPWAVPLSVDHRYFLKPSSQHSDFWKLMPFYVPQFNGAACSAASVTILLNALLYGNLPQAGDEKNITQQALLEKVKLENWKDRLSDAGYHGEYGMTLERLRKVTEEALTQWIKAPMVVESKVFSKVNIDSIHELESLLQKNEETSEDFIIVHFIQDMLTHDSEGGPYAHISPIGAYDAKLKKVLILDVDREFYQPYWVSPERLLTAMTTPTKEFGKGGLLWIHKKR